MSRGKGKNPPGTRARAIRDPSADKGFPRYRYPSVYRPVDVVHLRQELLNITRHTVPGRELASTGHLAAEHRWEDPGTGLINHVEGLDNGSIARWLESADLYLVSGPMENLARQAGAKMPEVAIIAEDLPSPRGMLVWAETTRARMDLASLVSQEARPPRAGGSLLDAYVVDVPMRAILWSVVSTKLGPGIAVTGLGDMRSMERAILSVQPGMPLNPEIRQWPVSLGDINGIVFGETGIWPGSPVGSTLIASWFLMSQAVSVTTHERVALPARRQGEARAPGDQEVRVVSLRRAKAVTEYGREPINEGRGYAVQFPVEGHWHTYWTGHGRATKRIRWVDTYVKGPEDAPFIGGERVNVLRR